MSDAKYKICCKHEVDLKAANWFPFENREVNPKQCFNMGVSRTKNFCWSSALTGGPVKFRQADGAYRGPSLFKLRVRSVNSLGCKKTSGSDPLVFLRPSGFENIQPTEKSIG